MTATTHTNTVSNSASPTYLVIVMGVSGSGKSTLAQALAERNDYVYLDGDDFHSAESREMMSNKIPLTDTQRAPWVLAIKQRLDANLKTATHTVLAFSGLKQKHRDLLRSAGLCTIFLFLHSDKRTIQHRLNQREHHFMAPELLDSQFDSLEDPSGEADVYPIDVSKDREGVIIEAQHILEKNLFSK